MVVFLFTFKHFSTSYHTTFYCFAQKISLSLINKIYSGFFKGILCVQMASKSNGINLFGYRILRTLWCEIIKLFNFSVKISIWSNLTRIRLSILGISYELVRIKNWLFISKYSQHIRVYVAQSLHTRFFLLSSIHICTLYNVIINTIPYGFIYVRTCNVDMWHIRFKSKKVWKTINLLSVPLWCVVII